MQCYPSHRDGSLSESIQGLHSTLEVAVALLMLLCKAARIIG